MLILVENLKYEEEAMATVFERVKKIIVEQLGVEESEVTLEASFADDLNADSLDLVELIMAIEEAFGSNGERMEIPDEDAEKLLTVKAAVEYLKEQDFEDE